MHSHGNFSSFSGSMLFDSAYKKETYSPPLSRTALYSVHFTVCPVSHPVHAGDEHQLFAPLNRNKKIKKIVFSYTFFLYLHFIRFLLLYLSVGLFSKRTLDDVLDQSYWGDSPEGLIWLNCSPSLWTTSEVLTQSFPTRRYCQCQEGSAPPSHIHWPVSACVGPLYQTESCVLLQWQITLWTRWAGREEQEVILKLWSRVTNVWVASRQSWNENSVGCFYHFLLLTVILSRKCVYFGDHGDTWCHVIILRKSACHIFLLTVTKRELKLCFVHQDLHCLKITCCGEMADGVFHHRRHWMCNSVGKASAWYQIPPLLSPHPRMLSLQRIYCRFSTRVLV